MNAVKISPEKPDKMTPTFMPPKYHPSYWGARKIHTIRSPIRTSGVYKIFLETSRPVCAEAHLFFAQKSEPPLFLTLDPQYQGQPNFYEKTIQTSSPCHELVFRLAPSGGTDEALILKAGVKRLPFYKILFSGAAKALKHIKNPLSFAQKMRHFFSGATALHSTNTGQQTQEETYKKWQQIFESSIEASFITQTLAPFEKTQTSKLLAIYLSGCRNEAALCSFLENYDLHKDYTTLLIVQDPKHPLNPRLIHRAKAVGARLLNQDSKNFSLKTILQLSGQSNITGFFFLERDGQYSPLAFQTFLLEFSARPQSLAVYGDYDHINQHDQRYRPSFSPDWSPEYALSWNYIGPPIAFRADDRFQDAIITHPQAAAYQLLLYAGMKGKAPISHVPRILFHQKEHNITPQSEDVENRIVGEWALQQKENIAISTLKEKDGTLLRQISYPLKNPPPFVSVLIPSKDNPAHLQDAVAAVLQADYPAKEIILIDNGSQDAAHLSLLHSFRQKDNISILTDARPFNFSALINKGRNEARGDMLVLLNDDIKAIEDGWLKEMACLASRDEIGCVGALLLYPDNKVQHAGVILGINGESGHALQFAPSNEDSPGYRLKLRREVTAVTGACLAIRSTLFDQVGGFDEDLPVILNDIDFCLKIAGLGKRNLFTPHARLYHHESVTRAKHGLISRSNSAQKIFFDRWGSDILEDPFYSPHFSRRFPNFRLRENL